VDLENKTTNCRMMCLNNRFENMWKKLGSACSKTLQVYHNTTNTRSVSMTYTFRCQQQLHDADNKAATKPFKKDMYFVRNKYMGALLKILPLRLPLLKIRPLVLWNT
jgi:hypothetical protein